MARMKKNGRLDLTSLTSEERELIAAFLMDRLMDFDKAESVARAMLNLRPGKEAYINQVQYNTNAISAVKHCLALVAMRERGDTSRIHGPDVGHPDSEACRDD